MDNSSINGLLVALAIATIPIITKWFLNDVLKVFTAWLQSKLKNDNTSYYIGKLDELVVESVLMVQQTFVQELKKNGNFDGDKQKEAFDKAMENVKALLSTEGYSILMEAYNDLEATIRMKIEANVALFK